MPSKIESLLASPIFANIFPQLSRFSDFDRVPTLQELQSILCDATINFVPQASKTGEFSDGYEPRIFLRGEVQTRNQNWHDFFNAVVWHRFPKIKRAINALQYELQKSHFPEKSRLPAENMLTLFDENGAIVIARDAELIELIRSHKWHELFWKRRKQVVEQLTVVVFGHALYEKAMHPYIGLTAQCLLFTDANVESLDSYVAAFLAAKGSALRTADLDPLPVLGIPGWWPENQDESFYANAKYFRS